MNRQARGKLTEALYTQILSDLVKENKFHKFDFSIEDLEKIASKRTLRIANCFRKGE